MNIENGEHRVIRLAVTCGEPAGIGPEISLRAAWELRDQVCGVLLGDAGLLQKVADVINAAAAAANHYAGADVAATADTIALDVISLQEWDNGAVVAWQKNRLTVIDIPLAAPVVPGTLDARNGRAVLQTLDVAIAGAMQRRFDAIVTAPLQKSTINDAGVAFTGHTEYLAEQTGTAQVVMMLAGPLPAVAASGASAGSSLTYMRVALATTHLALKDVPAAITRESLTRTIDILHADLTSRFGLAQPRILVTGLNPHAGENGYLGREEIDVITPVLAAAKLRGIDVSGPYPADTLFQHKYLERADCVLAMYHDQGLPVLKFATFGHGINVTLGLPIIRTSVDHGTALDLAAAGLGHAEHGSMVTAMLAAAEMAVAMAVAAPAPSP